MSAAETVAELIARSGLSKSALSERSGVSRALIDDYLKGRRQPSLAQLERLGEAARLRLDVVWERRTPRWAQPNPAMDAPPLTVAERAKVIELVCGMAFAFPSRERGPLEFPPFRTLVRR